MIVVEGLKRSGEVTQRVWNKAVKATYHEGAEFWFDRYSQRHFTPEGARMYGYAKRSRKYMDAKQSQKHHQDPLVWSGASRKLATIKQIRSTRNWGKASIAARGLNRRAKGMTYSMAREMVIVSANERRAMFAQMNRKLTSALKEAGRKKN